MTTLQSLAGLRRASCSSKAFPFTLPFILTSTPEAGIADPVLQVKCLCPLRNDTVTPGPAPVTSQYGMCFFSLKCWGYKKCLILKSLRTPGGSDFGYVPGGRCGLVGSQLAE